MAEIYVSQINYYPVKSCAGISLYSADLDARGIKHDRELMIVGKNKDGKYELVRQSKHPSMALILSNVGDDSFSVVAPRMPNQLFPIIKQGDALEVMVHKSACSAVDQGNEAAEWFSRYVGKDYKVVRMADNFVREVNPKYAPRQSDQVGFQDGYPLLMISEESLKDLNSRLSKPVRMNRFRPNLVVRGAGRPFIEDDLKQIRIGNVVYSAVKPCDRCPIPNIEQETGEVSREVIDVLNDPKYRRGEFGGKTAVWFGQNLVHQSPGEISIGDKVEILAYKKEDEKIKWHAEKAAM